MCDQHSLRSACTYAQSDQSLCLSLEYSMIVKLLTEHYLEFLSLKGCCRGSPESTHVKMPHCWKSHAAAHLEFSGTRVKYLDHERRTYKHEIRGKFNNASALGRSLYWCQALHIMNKDRYQSTSARRALAVLNSPLVLSHIRKSL